MARVAKDVICVCQRKATRSGFDSSSVRNSVLIIFHTTFWDCRVLIFFRTTFLERAVYGINIKVWTWATLVAARRLLSPLLNPCSPKMMLTVTLLFQLQSSYEVWTTVHLVLLVCLVPLVPPIHPICSMSLFI